MERSIFKNCKEPLGVRDHRMAPCPQALRRCFRQAPWAGGDVDRSKRRTMVFARGPFSPKSPRPWANVGSFGLPWLHGLGAIVSARDKISFGIAAPLVATQQPADAHVHRLPCSFASKCYAEPRQATRTTWQHICKLRGAGLSTDGVLSCQDFTA